MELEVYAQGNTWAIETEAEWILLPKPGSLERRVQIQSVARLFEIDGTSMVPANLNLIKPAIAVSVEHGRRWQLHTKGRLSVYPDPLLLGTGRQLQAIDQRLGRLEGVLETLVRANDARAAQELRLKSNCETISLSESSSLAEKAKSPPDQVSGAQQHMTLQPSWEDEPLNTLQLEPLHLSKGLLLRHGSNWLVEKQPVEVEGYREDLAEGVGLTMIWIPAGSFLMGSPLAEDGRSKDEGPQREVTLGSYFLGQTAITQDQWRVVAQWEKVEHNLNPALSKFRGDKRPVESVSWHEAKEFCLRLSHRTGKRYCLPSEAQWEYACRAGTTTPFHYGATLTPELANYNSNYTYGDGSKGTYRCQSTAVGSFLSNDWGLQDLHGNIWEWCEDHWHPSYESALMNDNMPWLIPAAEDRELRVLRGGSWINVPEDCRSAYRYGTHPGYRPDGVAFRVCCLFQYALS